jgi:protein-L-isoaspartate(D-aspartate) O-methyltransferase
MSDFLLQRKNMVESQVRPSDVTDRRIIRAMLDIPREMFVGPAQRDIAYMDEALTLTRGGHGHPRRQMPSPRVLAKLIQMLDLGEREIVLEIGAATGYGAAVLARIAQTVVALEADGELAAEAQRVLPALSIDNVAVVSGPLEAGYVGEGPFDAILINGSVADVPIAVLDQLKDGGRLVAVVNQGPAGRTGKATQWRRIGGNFDRRAVFDATAPLLPGFEAKPQFVF